MSDEEFQTTESGAAETYPAQCSTLRKGGYVVIKNRPCKVVDMSTSKTGKHGHAKVHLVALDIFTGKKLEDLCPSTHNVSVPNVTRTELQLIDLTDDDYLSLLLPSGDTKDDVKVTDDAMRDELRTAFDDGKDILCMIQKAMGEEKVVSWKEAPQS
eukprot:TRINITY_DN7615_c0_g1_i12.p3 TRINITY_DN7615_c0_g1~~TRINITY_DN7615_c0_g1_i12.p3  ORF type:complete len:156 (+),score=55.49 TRINITY_DN7615_c0_g1_i12:35-502(+)